MQATDAIQLLGHASFEIVQLRREDIKPQLNKEYGDLWSANVPVTEWLFGDDLQTKLTHIRTANRVGSTASQAHGFHRRGNRAGSKAPANSTSSFLRERRRHWGGKTSPRGTTEASRTHRTILNLKSLNQYVTYYHFKMDTIHTAVEMMTPGCYMCSVDLNSAYYSVAIAPSYQKYLKFSCRGKLYQFTCFPNGLAFCPRKFTKLLKPVHSAFELR